MKKRSVTLTDAVRSALIECRLRRDPWDQKEIEFCDDEQALLDLASQSDNNKTKAALILNALECSSSKTSCILDRIVDDIGRYGEQFIELFYSQEEQIAANETDGYALPEPHLEKYKDSQIVNVEMEGHLPRSILFVKLGCPIFSNAFGCIISEVRFGTKKDYIFSFDEYDDTREALEAVGISLPDNVYQMHHFRTYIHRYIDLRYVNTLMADRLENGLTGVFNLINILQSQHERCVYISYYKDDYTPENANSQEMANREILKINRDPAVNISVSMYGDWGPCREKRLVVSRDPDREEHYGMLYDSIRNRYMGVYYESREDPYVLYRSVPDFMISRLSSEETSLILVTLNTYIKDNNVSIDDGLDLKNDVGSMIDLVTDAFLWSEPFSNLYEDELCDGFASLHKGWK